MAPRKGAFLSNKVKPTESFKKFKSQSDSSTRQQERGDFFIRPASSGSTTEYSNTENKNVQTAEFKKEKKPFDKKKWRMQRYSKKYRVQQWEDKRKKAVLREYYKQIDDRPKFDVKKIYEEENEEEEDKFNRKDEAIATSSNVLENEVSFEEENENNAPGKKFDQMVFKGKKARQKAHEEFNRIKEEKKKSREEALKKKAEKQEAMKKSKEERTAKFKRLNKKTKKGQPIMKERMELLLEQIQKNLKK